MKAIRKSHHESESGSFASWLDVGATLLLVSLALLTICTTVRAAPSAPPGSKESCAPKCPPLPPLLTPGASCAVDLNTLSGGVTFKYQEVQTWSVAGPTVACATLPSRQCIPYHYTAKGSGSQTNAADPTKNRTLTVNNSGDGFFIKSTGTPTTVSPFGVLGNVSNGTVEIAGGMSHPGQLNQWQPTAPYVPALTPFTTAVTGIWTLPPNPPIQARCHAWFP